MRILLGLIPVILGSKIRFESKKKYVTKSEDLTGKDIEQILKSLDNSVL